MTLTSMPLLPVIIPAPRSREIGDRLELLEALIAAPGFDPVLRPDAIEVPGDHPVFGWFCRVPGCPRGAEPMHDYCHVHCVKWREHRDAGGNVAEFRQSADPLRTYAWADAPPCVVCPDVPAWSQKTGLCFLHADRWNKRSSYRRRQGQELDFETWLAGARPLPPSGKCQVAACPEKSDHPIGMCRRHKNRYEREGRPGGAKLPQNWGRWLLDKGKPIILTCEDRTAFLEWCNTTPALGRSNGKLSLLGLRPLVKAEIKWVMGYHAQLSDAPDWPVLFIQRLASDCRSQDVDSLADLDPDRCRMQSAKIARRMLRYLRLVYFTRPDTKDAGFIETEHFGVRYRNRDSGIDLCGVSQRWLRDLLWDWMAMRLTADAPRSRNLLDFTRRGCVELSAYLEAQAPGGGHDVTVLDKSHMEGFVFDQRHRAEHGLFGLGIHNRQGGSQASVVTKGVLTVVFSGVRRVLRMALDSGESEKIGLDRGFIVSAPHGGNKTRRRRPFPDDVARALAADANLQLLHGLDFEDRGLQDIWEALVLTGRRCSEVIEVRLECLGRLNGLPLFWHDQTKVGNYDEAIRIPERLHRRLEQRQLQSVERFAHQHGRPPTGQERRELALFPRRSRNRTGQHAVSYTWFSGNFRTWVKQLDIGHHVAHQARHTLATNLLRNGANLSHVKRYLGQVSQRMAEHYTHLANTDPRLEDALNAVWVTGPGSAEPGLVLAGGDPMTREQAEALAVDLTRQSTPAEGGFCTFQPVVNGDACPWNMDCHNCDKFVLSGADLVYWHRKREQWRAMAERAPDSKTADYLHDLFEPSSRAIAGLEKALEGVGLLDEALALDLRRPQDYFGRVWSMAFRARALAEHEGNGEDS
ncbi:tyrosine-type recombinase/integrase [Streptomyces anulatus]|uniref:tyrosine-type recombinase/integrase n=1 Tax=Streptomyces anulatus TaxID=1892 RepID=UPI0036DE7B81